MSSTSTQWILELVDRVSAPMKKITSVGRRAEKTTKRVSTAMNRLKTTALATFGALAVFRGIAWIAKLGIDAEQTDIKFEVLLGSAAKAGKMIENIDQLANKTTFDNIQLKKSAELLLNYGIAGDKIIPTISMLSDIAGDNKDRLNSLSLAYAQVQSTGKLMGQDLLQLINAGFNPLKIMAEKSGKSIGYWKDQAQKGAVSASMVADAFKIATSEGGAFYKMQEKLNDTAGGQISNFFGTLKSNIANFAKDNISPVIKSVFKIANAFIEASDPVIQALKNLVEPFKPLFAAIGSLISLIFGFGEESFKVSTIIDTLSRYINYAAFVFDIISNAIVIAINVITPFVPLLKGLAIIYGIMTVRQWALNIAMTANPIGLVIVAVIGLIAIFQTLWNKSEQFRGFLYGLWAGIKGFGSAIKEYIIDRLKGVLSGITGIAQAIKHLFNREWKQAWEVGKQAASDLIGVDARKKAIDNMVNVGKDMAHARNKGIAAVYQKNNPLKVKTTNETELGADPTADQLALGGEKPVLNDESDASGSVKNGISGSKGQGKIITQNLNITNHFNVDKDARVSMEDLADILAGKLNDKLRDGLIALN